MRRKIPQPSKTHVGSCFMPAVRLPKSISITVMKHLRSAPQLCGFLTCGKGPETSEARPRGARSRLPERYWFLWFCACCPGHVDEKNKALKHSMCVSLISNWIGYSEGWSRSRAMTLPRYRCADSVIREDSRFLVALEARQQSITTARQVAIHSRSCAGYPSCTLSIDIVLRLHLQRET